MMQVSCKNSIDYDTNGADDAFRAWDELRKTVLQVSHNITVLFGDLIVQIFKATIASESQRSSVDIGEVPKLSECWLPFFVDERN